MGQSEQHSSCSHLHPFAHRHRFVTEHGELLNVCACRELRLQSSGCAKAESMYAPIGEIGEINMLIAEHSISHLYACIEVHNSSTTKATMFPYNSCTIRDLFQNALSQYLLWVWSVSFNAVCMLHEPICAI
jgi:hypothetical protein